MTAAAASTVRPPRRAVGWATAAAALTVFDAAATYLWVVAGIAVEGNPILAPLVDDYGPGPAMALRTAVGLALVAALLPLAGRARLALPALRTATVALALVAGYHLYGGTSGLL